MKARLRSAMLYGTLLLGFTILTATQVHAAGSITGVWNAKGEFKASVSLEGKYQKLDLDLKLPYLEEQFVIFPDGTMLTGDLIETTWTLHKNKLRSVVDQATILSLIKGFVAGGVLDKSSASQKTSAATGDIGDILLQFVQIKTFKDFTITADYDAKRGLLKNGVITFFVDINLPDLNLIGMLGLIGMKPGAAKPMMPSMEFKLKIEDHFSAVKVSDSVEKPVAGKMTAGHSLGSSLQTVIVKALRAGLPVGQ